MGIQPSASALFGDANRNPLSKRRSARIGLNALVGMSGQDRQKFHFTMPAKATHLNRYGASIQLPRELEVGSKVLVKNRYGAEVTARVVAQVNVLESGVRTYGIEFADEGEGAKQFWGITFPVA